MKSRRALLRALGAGGLIAGTWPAIGQQPAGKVFRIGVLGNNPPGLQSASWNAFVLELRQRGYTEGRNIVFEGRYAGNDTARLDALAAELVAVRVDLIYTTSGTFGALAAKRATSAIPIVMNTSADPVASGLIASLSHPGGNVTGNAILGLVLGVKRLEILAQAAGKPTRLAYLAYASVRSLSHSGTYAKDLTDSARSLGAQLQFVHVESADDLPQAFDAMARDGVDGVVVDNFGFGSYYGLIASLSLSHRLPAVAEGKSFVDAGGLVAYGVRTSDLGRNAAVYVDKILRGAKPGQLPVEQASTYNLYINLKTAKALGITVPQSLLLRVDEVIQ